MVTTRIIEKRRVFLVGMATGKPDVDFSGSPSIGESPRCQPSVRRISRKRRPLLPPALPIPSQICYGICAIELPDFEYFGTQYSIEVRPTMAVSSPAAFFEL